MGPARIRNARVKSMCVSPPFLMSSSTHIRKGGLGLTNSVSSSVCCGFKPLVSFESGSEEDTEAGICFLPTEGFFSFSGTLSFSSPLSSNKAAMNADLRDAGHGIPPDECLTGKNAPSDQMCWSLSCAIITYLLFSARQYRYVYDCFTYLTTRTKTTTPTRPSIIFRKLSHLSIRYTMPPTGCMSSIAPHPTALLLVELLVRNVAERWDPIQPILGKGAFRSDRSRASRQSFVSSCRIELSSRADVCDSVPFLLLRHRWSLPRSSACFRDF